MQDTLLGFAAILAGGMLLLGLILALLFKSSDDHGADDD
jgi:hypothetical protein